MDYLCIAGNELNSDIKLAAQIVLGLVILIITLLALPRFQQVASILELIVDVVGSLVSLVVILLRLNEVPLADINQGQNDIPLTDAEGDVANGQNDVIVNEELKI
ncbi:hypothetical protein SO802_027734 [Lithocarpus litseifolius]|uniref:Uncharacterized protein n=1 Tax=Lithocarpus litseifolius TaxID=425828 RepID=A0AAW2BTY2_9ROSI